MTIDEIRLAKDHALAAARVRDQFAAVIEYAVSVRLCRGDRHLERLLLLAEEDIDAFAALEERQGEQLAAIERRTLAPAAKPKRRRPAASQRARRSRRRA